MTNENLILITSANGKTGRMVLKALVKRGANVRAFIRDEKQFEALQALGAKECFVGDLGRQQDLADALKGVSKVFHIGPPMHPEETEITRMLVDAAKSAGVEHFVYYSVMHPIRREVRHHRLKLDGEEHLIESDLPYTILQPSRYMQHLAPIWSKVVNDNVHMMPFSVDKRFSVVDLEDLAEASAIVATEPGHLYAVYELAGAQALSQKDMAATISEVIGKKVEARATDWAALEAAARANGANEDRVEQMLTMNRHYDRHGFQGNPNVLTMILGRKPTPYKTFVERLAGGAS